MAIADGKDVTADALALIRAVITPAEVPPGTQAHLLEGLLEADDPGRALAEKMRDSARIADAINRLKLRPVPAADPREIAFRLSTMVEVLAKIAANAIRLYASETSRDPAQIVDNCRSGLVVQDLKLEEPTDDPD